MMNTTIAHSSTLDRENDPKSPLNRVTGERLDEVLYFQSRDHLIHVFFDGGASRTIRQKISTLAPSLPEDFMRIHKSFIIARSRIKRLIVGRGGRYRVELTDGSLLPLSRRLYPVLRPAILQASGAGTGRAHVG